MIKSATVTRKLVFKTEDAEYLPTNSSKIHKRPKRDVTSRMWKFEKENVLKKEDQEDCVSATNTTKSRPKKEHKIDNEKAKVFKMEVGTSKSGEANILKRKNRIKEEEKEEFTDNTTSTNSKQTIHKKENKEIKEPKMEAEAPQSGEGNTIADDVVATASNPKKKRLAKKTNTIKDPPMAYNNIANNSKKIIGAHVSSAGGIYKAIENALSLGCRSFGLFLQNQRTWSIKPLKETDVENWHRVIEETGFPLNQIVPHGSYLLNAGSAEQDKLQKTREVILDECQRCERLGIRLYNFHPGSSVGKCSRDRCIRTIAETINFVQGKTNSVTLVIETMPGSGNQIGGSFLDLADIIRLVKDKTRVGICIDTCHIFAAGYDIRSKSQYDEVMEDFDITVGFEYLKAFHLNDSQGECRSKLDRHANIGHGKLTLKPFEYLMKDPRFDNIPMILETPEGKYSEEIEQLYKLELQ